ncbi:MAG TPA: putative baseplate assembly protein [Caulobacteraceae bacterium]|jgi:predicted phage baseplate assembly protein
MPLTLPVIDDRTFDDIVAEARTRIPRYTAEWTDFNSGDAGFALVELFAWMSELLIYRLGQVPMLNYIKFLQLIGIELTPARPAEVVLTFPVQAGYTLPTVPAPARTQVSAAASDGGNPIVFETQSAITALQASLDAVVVFDGFNYADVSAANAAPTAAGFQPFGSLASVGAALMLGFKSALPPAANAELSLSVWPLMTPATRPISPCAGASPVFASATLAWEYWDGSDWSALRVLADETLAFTAPGFVRLKLPAASQLTTAKLGGKTDAARLWLRARLAASDYEAAPILTLVRANAVRALAAQTVLGEVLGGSNGQPNQAFTLSSTPVLDASLVLAIDEGGGPQVWTQVNDFAAAGPNDLAYMLDPTTGVVRLGDGVDHGHIPVANLANPNASIVAQSYRFGGGARTNIAAASPLTLMTSLPGIDTSNIANPFPADSGADEEDIQNAIDRAPEALMSQDRAVTASDFELLATQAGPVSRAKALPLFNPNFPGQSVPGTVTVIVVPDVDAPEPMPSAGLLRTVCAYLDQRRLVTTELYVIGPTYTPVSITLDVLAEPDADTGAVEDAVEAAITAFLDPRRGGPEGTGWPFGGAIYFVDLLRTALVTDVIRVANLTVTVNGTIAPACTDVAIAANALVGLQSVTANVSTDPAALGSIA